MYVITSHGDQRMCRTWKLLVIYLIKDIPIPRAVSSVKVHPVSDFLTSVFAGLANLLVLH